MLPACTPRRSDLTQSEFLGSVADLEDRIGEAVDLFRKGGTLEDLTSDLEAVADELRTLGEDLIVGGGRVISVQALAAQGAA